MEAYLHYLIGGFVKIMFAYTVWSRAPRVPQMLDASRKCFNLGEGDRVVLAFDDCELGIPLAAGAIAGSIFQDGVYSEVIMTGAREIGMHNALLTEFGGSDCDALVVYQDDMIPTGRIKEDVEAILQKYGLAVFVGGRDGWTADKKMLSSSWSYPQGQRTLADGEVVPVRSVNSGPMIYGRETTARAGMIDEEFVAFYAWGDYAMRCEQAGVPVLVLGTRVAHDSHIYHGELTSGFITAGIGRHDSERLREKWGEGFLCG